MFLSTIELGPEAESSQAFWKSIAAPGGAHRAIWRLFSRHPEQRRDFLFRHEVAARGRPRFFVLSAQPPAEDVDDGLWSIETKPFAPKLSVGDRLQFSLRASPTVTKPIEKGGKSHRHDIVMNAKLAAEEGAPPCDVVLLVQETGERWLRARSARSGFELESGTVERVGDDGLIEEQEVTLLKVDGYQQHCLYRRSGEPIRFSTMDFEGVLIVREPKTFLDQVTQGFGPQKAFGCGLMLLKRA